MVHRPLGNTPFRVSPIGFGAFKIGRNTAIKYPAAYDLPTDDQVNRLLAGLWDLGINYIDTAPAYGSSEERLGRALAQHPNDFVISTKVGETFENSASRYDFSDQALHASLTRSLHRLGRDALDIVFIHSDGRDLDILNHTNAVSILRDYKRRGLVRAIGLSGKTIDGARAALDWADLLMVEYNLTNPAHHDLITEAHRKGLGVVVKKGLGSGHLPPADAIRFVMSHPGVDTLVIGGLNLDHFRHNLDAATALRQPPLGPSTHTD